MHKKQISIIAFVFLMAISCVVADGKMFGKWIEGDALPLPKIPYQRAIIGFRDGTQTLILQSKYEIAQTNPAGALGWVVPILAQPEVASMSTIAADGLFEHLDSISQLRFTNMRLIVGFFVILSILALLIYFFFMA